MIGHKRDNDLPFISESIYLEKKLSVWKDSREKAKSRASAPYKWSTGNPYAPYRARCWLAT